MCAFVQLASHPQLSSWSSPTRLPRRRADGEERDLLSFQLASVARRFRPASATPDAADHRLRQQEEPRTSPASLVTPGSFNVACADQDVTEVSVFYIVGLGRPARRLEG